MNSPFNCCKSSGKVGYPDIRIHSDEVEIAANPDHLFKLSWFFFIKLNLQFNTLYAKWQFCLLLNFLVDMVSNEKPSFSGIRRDCAQ